MSLAHSDTFAEHVYIPPTDDDDDSPDQTSSLEPTHNQPTAPRYMHRMLRAYHATPTGDASKLKKPDSFHSLTHWFALYNYAVTGRDETYLGPDKNTTQSVSAPNEKLQNICMDAIREYYRNESITATTFRIENLYKSLAKGEGDLMKQFLLETVVWRLKQKSSSTGFKAPPPEPHSVWVRENTGANAKTLSPSFTNMLDRNPELCKDFYLTMAVALQYDSRTLVDPRKDRNEEWHVGPRKEIDGGTETERRSSKDSGFDEETGERNTFAESLRKISLAVSAAMGA